MDIIITITNSSSSSSSEVGLLAAPVQLTCQVGAVLE
jgi:hypothetical protein